jgi:hypothetical protein
VNPLDTAPLRRLVLWALLLGPAVLALVASPD